MTDIVPRITFTDIGAINKSSKVEVRHIKADKLVEILGKVDKLVNSGDVIGLIKYLEENIFYHRGNAENIFSLLELDRSWNEIEKIVEPEQYKSFRKLKDRAHDMLFEYRAHLESVLRHDVMHGLDKFVITQHIINHPSEFFNQPDNAHHLLDKLLNPLQAGDLYNAFKVMELHQINYPTSEICTELNRYQSDNSLLFKRKKVSEWMIGSMVTGLIVINIWLVSQNLLITGFALAVSLGMAFVSLYNHQCNLKQKQEVCHFVTNYSIRSINENKDYRNDSNRFVDFVVNGVKPNHLSVVISSRDVDDKQDQNNQAP